MGKRPDLFTAYFHVSSQWDRAYEPVVRQQGLTDAEIDELLVLDIKEHDYFTERNAPNEHGGGYFAHDEEIMGWLFSK